MRRKSSWHLQSVWIRLFVSTGLIRQSRFALHFWSGIFPTLWGETEVKSKQPTNQQQGARRKEEELSDYFGRQNSPGCLWFGDGYSLRPSRLFCVFWKDYQMTQSDPQTATGMERGPKWKSDKSCASSSTAWAGSIMPKFGGVCLILNLSFNRFGDISAVELSYATLVLPWYVTMRNLSGPQCNLLIWNLQRCFTVRLGRIYKSLAHGGLFTHLVDAFLIR
jgi:hypothetical protein